MKSIIYRNLSKGSLDVAVAEIVKQMRLEGEEAHWQRCGLRHVSVMAFEGVHEEVYFPPHVSQEETDITAAASAVAGNLHRRTCFTASTVEMEKAS